MSFEKEIPSNVEVVNILGINDKNLKYIKSVFPEVKINVRGNTIYIDGKSKEAKEVIRIFDEMLMMNDNDENIEETDVALLSNIKNGKSEEGKKISSISIIENKTIKVKNINQMIKIIRILLNKKNNYKNIKSKINNLGNKVLNNTFKEINLLIKNDEIKKT